MSSLHNIVKNQGFPEKTAPITTKVYTAHKFIVPAVSHLFADFGTFGIDINAVWFIKI
jgi:hypothetical protein